MDKFLVINCGRRIPLIGISGEGKSALVDVGDYSRVIHKSSRWYVCSCKRRKTSYARASVVVGHNTREAIKMHRFILGAEPGTFVDHVNGNGLDNRRKNIRICTKAENNCNKGPRIGLRYKGITRASKCNRWIAQIKKGSLHRYIGIFKTQEEAALAYNEAAKELHGEFARLNEV